MAKNITLLFAAVNTKSQKIDTGPEYQSIKETFEKAECHPLFTLSINNIGRKLDEYKPHILHISAHGEINGKLVVPNVLEEELTIDVDRLSAFLADYRRHLGLVLFCACHSDVMARKIVRHLPVSIGFKDVLDDDKAKLFSERFYAFLNKNPSNYYQAYLRAKKECSLKGQGTPRFYFRETAPYQWNEAAWKVVFRLLLDKEQLDPVLRKAGLNGVTISTADASYFDVLYYQAFAMHKLVDLRDAIDDDVLKKIAPALTDFETDLIRPIGYDAIEPAVVRAVSYREIKKDKNLNFLQSWFSSWGIREKQEIALKALNVFDGNEIHDFLRTFQHYLPLPCRDSKGQSGEFVDFLFRKLNDPKNRNRYYLLLGETGVGKTTALAYLFTRFVRARSRYQMLFTQVDKGLNQIYQLKDQEETILLLDGIDEAFEALHDAEAFFRRVEQNTRNFAKVVISCRTQFFVNQAAEPRQTDTNPRNAYQKIYLEFLDMEVVKREVEKSYPVGTNEYRIALSLVRQSGDLFKRPLLLLYIKDMVEHKDEFLFFRPDAERMDSVITSYEIYDIVIRKWIDRERDHNSHYDGDYGQALFDVSLKLAEYMYESETQERRKYIYYVDLKRIQRKYQLQIGEIQLRDRSLLHRNAEGYYRFAHRTFKEFFYAHLLYEGLISEEEFPFDVYEDAARFYREMCQVNYFRKRKENQRRLYTPKELNLQAPSFVFSCQPIQVICHFEGVDFSDSAFLIFKALTASGVNYFDCFFDIAEYLVNKNATQIPEKKLIDLCDRYDLAASDLLSCFFFYQTGKGFHFIHRSFAEFFCLYDMLQETDDEGVRETIEHFPFSDRLHLFRLFANEIQWLGLRQQYEGVQLLTDHHGVSLDEFNLIRSERGKDYSWVDYGNEKALIRFSNYGDYLYRLRQTKTLKISLQNLDVKVVLSAIPFPEWITHLDLSHNDINGPIGLNRFINLESLTVSGNPALSLADSELPDKLLHIISAEGMMEGKNIRRKNLQILVSPNVDTGFKRSGPHFLAPEMVAVIGEKFWMGSEEDEPEASKDEKPLHLVQLSNYFIGKYPVTVDEFACFVHETGYVTTAEIEGWSMAAIWRENTLGDFIKVGCNWRHDVYGKPIDDTFARHPVIHVSWHDAMAYCSWLVNKTNKRYGLPTEAQWEYAAIGGHKANLQDEQGCYRRKFTYAGGDKLADVGWFFDKFRGEPRSDFGSRAVGGLQPNELGIFDMSGNVWEWCMDWYDNDYYQKCMEKEIALDPSGAELGSYRVNRGGSWNNTAQSCRAAYRLNNTPFYRSSDVGFRVAL